MTARPVRLCLMIGALLALSGCVSREQADEKLAKGCEAGVNALREESSRLKQVLKAEFSDTTEGHNMRHVRLTAIPADSYLEDGEVFECIFEENFGPFNTAYEASVYQVRAGDVVIGKSGNTIMGSAEDFMKMNDAMRDVMYR